MELGAPALKVAIRLQMCDPLAYETRPFPSSSARPAREWNLSSFRRFRYPCATLKLPFTVEVYILQELDACGSMWADHVLFEILGSKA
jgi:hypothetical protein